MPKQQNNKTPEENNTFFNLRSLLGIAVVVVLIRFGGAQLFLALAAAVFFAAIVGTLLRKKPQLINVFYMVTLLTWVIPILGIFTFSTAVTISIQSKTKTNNHFMLAGVLGLVLAIFNSVSGVLLDL